MRYLECTLDTPPEEMDLRCEVLASFGVDGFVIENEEDFRAFLRDNTQYWDYVYRELEDRFRGLSRVKFYLPDDGNGSAVLARVQEEYPALSVCTVDDSDWENRWRDYYKPIPVGEKLLVVPEWEQIPPGGRLPLILDPGLIFGTGSHATTRMCLQTMESYADEGKHVLDLGCGSGILGIGALILGCTDCLGVDIDPKAPDVAAGNAALNGFGRDRIRFLAGDLLADPSLRNRLGTGYDIVFANIVADVILSLTPSIPSYLNKDGVYICSGIIEGRQNEVQTVLERSGFTVERHVSEDDWHCFAARLSSVF